MQPISRKVVNLAALRNQVARHAFADKWMANVVQLRDPFQLATDRGTAQPCWQHPQPERDAQINWFHVAQRLCLPQFYRFTPQQPEPEPENDDEQIPAYLDPVHDRQRFGLIAIESDTVTCGCRAVKLLLENCPNCGRA